MKRQFILFITLVFIISSVGVVGFSEDGVIREGVRIEYNSCDTGYSSVIYNDAHYLPLRKIFEKMGAFVFYRSRDNKILALTRDGDMIYHISGENKIIVNDTEFFFDKSSLLLNNELHIPVGMLMTALGVDGIVCENDYLNIQKNIYTFNYHQIVKDVLDFCKTDTFIEEYFKRYISYHGNNPNLSMEEVIFRVNTGLDYPFYENISNIENPYLLLVLVNKYNKLPEGYTQYNLVNISSSYGISGNLLAGVAYENYIKMADAARNEGLNLRIVSAYRTEAYQRSLYNSRVRTTGKINADNYSARPGHSEHQTGLAVDINSTKGVFEYSNEFKWLQKHAHEYGFIMRYPKDKEWITGYKYEPWHYRYVGVDAAALIHNEGITYEEYYAKYILANDFI